MQVVGFILMIVGGLGAVATFAGIVQSSGPVGNPTIWGAVAAVGVVVYFLFRRPAN